MLWSDASGYCDQITQQARAAGRIPTNSVYRLPTEAEWEYACRAWTSDRRYSYGDDLEYTNLANYAWYDDNGSGMTHPVGTKLPNPWGLYDMHGNTRNWCQDSYAAYRGGIAVDPQGPPTGSGRVARGAFFNSNAILCRSAYRNNAGIDPAFRYPDIGFRVVLSQGQP